MSNMEKLENELSFALVTLNSFAVRGPLIVPIGKAMEAVSRALGMAQEMRAEDPRGSKGDSKEDPSGPCETAEEEKADETAQHEVQ